MNNSLKIAKSFASVVRKKCNVETALLLEQNEQQRWEPEINEDLPQGTNETFQKSKCWKNAPFLGGQRSQKLCSQSD